MAALALADVLPDFAPQRKAEPVRAAPAPAAAEKAPGAPETAFTAPVPGPSIEEKLAEHEAAVTARLNEAHEAAIEAERQKHAGEVDALRAQLGEASGGMIARHFEEMEGRLAGLASASAARILAAVLSEDLQKRSVEQLDRVIRRALRDNEAVNIRVHGPLSLFESIKPTLGDRLDQVSYVEAPGFDLSVTIDDSIFETRMAEWSEALSEVLS